MADSRSSSALRVALTIALCIGFGAVSYSQSRKLDFDFKHFYLDARTVWNTGALNPDFDNPDPNLRRQLPFYLPIVPLALSPLGGPSPGAAALVWTLAQVAALAYCVKKLADFRDLPNRASTVREGFHKAMLLLRSGRFSEKPLPYGRGSAGKPESSDGASERACFLTLALGLPVLYEMARFNQLSLFVLAMLLAAHAALRQRRDWLGGSLIALATLLKLLPGVFLLWLLLKRRWSATLASGVTLVVVGLLPPLLYFGPRQAVAQHQEWWRNNVQGVARTGLTDAALREHFIDHRNQSIGAVVARLCNPDHPYAVAHPLARFDETTCRRLALGLSVAGLAWLAFALRRPARALSPTRERIEFAVVALAMLIFSPLLRQYYLVWALPALLALLQSAGSHESRTRGWGMAGAALWIAGMIAWTFPAARLTGVHLFMLIGMAACLLALRPESTAIVNEDPDTDTTAA